MKSALISIKPNHVENILNGLKTVELRTRNINLPVGAKLWIYSTLPTGCIEAVAKIDFIHTQSPSTIWNKYGKSIHISKKSFDDYTKGRKKVTAIGLKDIKETDKSLCLKTLRDLDDAFLPPQFFINLTPDKKIYSAFI